jgi:hypothetical protein
VAPSSPAPEEPEAGSAAAPLVESADVVAASVRKADTPESTQPEPGPEPASRRVEEEWLASAQKQWKRPNKSAPQKRENPGSALAPQYLSLNRSFQCNRG